MREDMPFPTEVVEDSEDEGMLMDLPRRMLMERRAEPREVSSIQQASITAQHEVSRIETDTSFHAHQQPKPLSQPPIAVLPGASEDTTIMTNGPPPNPRPKPQLKKKSPFALPADLAGSSSSNPTTATSISSATPATSVHTSDPSSAVKPRPKPRPKFKKLQNTDVSTIENPSTVSLPNAGPSADPIATASSRIQDASPMSMIEDPSGFSLDIADRAKLRGRASKEKKAVVKPSDVIEISDDDEISMLPPVKPKPSKPKKDASASKLPAKRTKTAQLQDAPGPESTPGSLPAPTSDFSMHLGSQLPPSDPPLPSTGPAPPTSTPPNVQLPPARALSPTSPISEPHRKRKRAVMVFDSDDELGGPMKSSNGSGNILMPPPPPPFFASSSSASAASTSAAPRAAVGSVHSSSSMAPGVQAGVTTKKRNPRKRKNTDDDDILVPEDESGKPKPKSRRKKTNEDDEEFGGAPKPKPKRKSAAKPKKSELQVEVLLDPPKPRSRNNTRSHEIVPETRPGGANTVLPPNSKSGTAQPGNAADETVKDASPAPATGPTSIANKQKGRQVEEADSKSDAPQSSKAKGKRRAIESSDEGEDNEPAPKASASSKKGSSRKDASSQDTSNSQSSTSGGIGRSGSFKENSEFERPPPPTSPVTARTPAPKASFSRANSIVPNGKSTPMSELIRKVNSQPGSPFTSARPNYSPFLKSSRSMLRKIAPLHPNRRTPPPPPPRPPPPKKSKKELEREEKWEEELEDSVEGWYCLSEEERAALRRAKRNAEMGYED